MQAITTKDLSLVSHPSSPSQYLIKQESKTVGLMTPFASGYTVQSYEKDADGVACGEELGFALLTETAKHLVVIHVNKQAEDRPEVVASERAKCAVCDVDYPVDENDTCNFCGAKDPIYRPGESFWYEEDGETFGPFESQEEAEEDRDDTVREDEEDQNSPQEEKPKYGSPGFRSHTYKCGEVHPSTRCALPAAHHGPHKQNHEVEDKPNKTKKRPMGVMANLKFDANEILENLNANGGELDRDWVIEFLQDIVK